MKIITLLSLLVVTTQVYARHVNDFNKVLLENVSKDIIKDEEQFKTRATRAPASVENEIESIGQEESKIDKNVRQTGHKQW